jgi:isopentenyl phosphate kinase
MRASDLSANLTVLKIGGSVITNKTQPSTANTSAIERLAEEISEAKVSHLILAHGGGSFGHPFAKKYAIKEGYRGGRRQLLGFSKTHQSMVTLNKLVVDALIQHNIPAVSVSPSSCIVTKSGRIDTFLDKPVNRLLATGFVPVFYGDAVLDSDQGFTILSGDQIVAYLAMKFNAERILMGADVDGLFTNDPKKVKTARFIASCTSEDLKKMQARVKAKKTKVTDVTGGMLGKIIELIPAVEKGIPAQILNAAQPRNVYKALRGEKIVGTLIRKA